MEYDTGMDDAACHLRRVCLCILPVRNTIVPVDAAMIRSNNNDSGPTPFTFAWFVMWVTILLENIMRIIQGLGSTADPSLPAQDRSQASTAPTLLASPYSERRSLASYINSGLSKVERARRSSAVSKQFSGSMRTIKLTQGAIRSATKPMRRLFSGYLDVLTASRDRLKSLYNELRETERHLRGYDVHAIEAEITRLERHAATNADIQSTLQTRREILSAVQGFEGRWAFIANQIASIAAALELNHLRIVSILGGTGSVSDSLRDRLGEASEQIAILEETLRELS